MIDKAGANSFNDQFVCTKGIDYTGEESDYPLTVGDTRYELTK